MLLKNEDQLSKDKNAFKNVAILLLTLIIPLLISATAIFAAYYIPTNTSLYAGQICSISTSQYPNVLSNTSQYNSCVRSNSITFADNEFSNLARHLNELFVILFLSVILLIAYIFFSKGKFDYLFEITISISIIWEFLFLTYFAFFNGAIYASESGGIPVTGLSGVAVAILSFVYVQTNKIIVNFVIWYLLLFFIIFIELIFYTINRAIRNKK